MKIDDRPTPMTDAFGNRPIGTWGYTTDDTALKTLREWSDFARRLEQERDALKEALELCYDHCRLYHRAVETNNVGETVRSVLASIGRKDVQS